MNPPATLGSPPLRALAALVLLALPLLPGCGSKLAAPPAPAAPLPPQIKATVPVARSAGVMYDTDIHVDFARPMDAATVTAPNILLKQDTRRIPIVVSYDPAALRARIVPQVALDLERTYTVHLGPGLLAADGGTFGPSGWFFQFTTNGARRPTNPRPQPGTSGESPFVELSWDTTEASAGTIQYEVWTGSDSGTVAARAGNPLTVVNRGRWLPTRAWPLGGPVYWAITVVNATSGERLDGPVQRFATLDPSTPQDSLTIPAGDSGYAMILYFLDANHPYQTCNPESVLCQPSTICWIWFPLSALPADVHVASAQIEVATYPAYVPRLPSTLISMWSSVWDWTRPCRPGLNYYDDLPSNGQNLAVGAPMGGNWILFASDLLSSFVEASVRRGDTFGYSFVSVQHIALAGAHAAPVVQPVLKIHYFRTSS